MNPLDMFFLFGVYVAIAAGSIAAAIGGVSVIMLLLARPKKAKAPLQWVKGSVIALGICFVVAVPCVLARILIASGAA